ncbi:MAG: thiosulfate sulfurtransferase [Gammaproteobacteria bacterium]|nr:MAG: thiosulfate sulfurtransferase [Gammaproteobacteria bacterium]
MSESLNLPLVIEPDELEKLLGNPDLLLVDLSSPDQYRRAHVPGAVFVPFQQTMAGVPPVAGGLPPVAHLQQLLSAIGLTPEKTVVVYDDEGGGWAGRFIWLLDSVGHQRYAYLNGGIHGWLADGKQPQVEPASPVASEYTVSLNNACSVDKDYLINNYQRDDLVVWDARSAGEYLGTRVNALKAGHIPGAKNYEWTRAMDRHRALKIRDHQTLINELQECGISKDKEVITHCQTHHRSGFTYLLGKILGFPGIKAYPGSWSEWGNDPDTPVEL